MNCCKQDFHAEQLAHAYRQFYGKKARLLVAFRHPSVHDPTVMVHLFSRLLPAAARQLGMELGGKGHAHFLYGRGVLNWARGGAAFLISSAGIPVMNRRNNTRSMRTIRSCLSDGPFPVCLAPEGQVSCHNHRLGPIEGGTARLAQWYLEDLERQGRDQEASIVPVACHYLYYDEPEKLFDRLVQRILRQGGLQPPSAESRREVLLELITGLLEKMEAFYARFCARGRREVDGTTLRQRIEQVCLAALKVPEGFMGIQPEQDLLSRVFNVRQRGWDYLFRSDLPVDGRISPLDRVLADRVADETYLHLRHNELVDVLEYLHG